MNTNVEVKLTQLNPNPYRDLKLFPINEVVKASLMESIKDTDFWDNLVIRLAENQLADGTAINSATELQALFEAGHDFSQEEFELCYGHHRLAALEDLGWEKVTLPVKHVDDSTMLKMMANENKDSQMNQIAVKLETVRQVKQELEKSLAAYENFTAYKKDGGTLYKNKQGFENAVKNGVGFRAVKKFLGETWSETDIRYSYSVLSHIDDGLFLQEDIIDVPSIGLLEAIGGIASFLFKGDGKKDTVAPDWPSFFKTKAINDIIERCRVDAKGWQKVTVAQLRKAKSVMVNDGVNPASYLKSGSAKNAFDIVKATKELVFDKDKSLEVNIAAVEELRDSDGFMDYHDIDELIKRVSDSITKSLSRSENTEGDLEPIEEGDLEAQIAAAESEVAVPDMFKVPGDIEGDSPTPIAVLAQTYVQTSVHVCSGIDQIRERIGEMGEDESFDTATIALLTTVVKLTKDRLGKESLIEVINAI